MTNKFNPKWYKYSAYNTECVIAWFDRQADAVKYLDFLNSNNGRTYSVNAIDAVSSEDEERYQQMCVITSDTLSDIYL